jgi:hypothetical protein
MCCGSLAQLDKDGIVRDWRQHPIESRSLDRASMGMVPLYRLMDDVGMDNRVNIRPGVSVLSVLRHLKYSYWHALAEFVDNALQSWSANREQLARTESGPRPLTVTIALNEADEGSIIVRDNAAGIPRREFARAFKPAAAPVDRSGLSEFGMGMKSAACWCARKWSVRTKPLDEPFEYLVKFDVDQIVAQEIEDLEIITSPAEAGAHYTEIGLQGLCLRDVSNATSSR